MEEDANPIEETLTTGDCEKHDLSMPEKTTGAVSEDVSSDYDGKPEAREHTRSKMAVLFVLGFFSILFLCFVYAIITGAKLSELKDTLVALIGALSGTLGFIVGYYYKSVQEQ